MDISNYKMDELEEWVTEFKALNEKPVDENLEAQKESNLAQDVTTPDDAV